MNASQIQVVVLGSAAVVMFDLLASIASRTIGFPYTRASFGSYLPYLAIGFFAARVAPLSAIAAAAGSAAIAGLVDASIGWAIAWAVGPGRPPNAAQLTVARWFAIAIFVVALAGVIGAVGGIAGRRSASTVAAV